MKNLVDLQLKDIKYDEIFAGSGFPPARSCAEDSVGIQIFDLKKSEFDDTNNNNGAHKGKLTEGLRLGINRYCTLNSCPSGGESIKDSDVTYGPDVVERSNNLYLSVCIVRSSLRFGNAASLFSRQQLREILADSVTISEIRTVFPKRLIVADPPKSKGLKGWQIALIAVGCVAFVALIAGAIIFAKKKKNSAVQDNS
ncbi:DgyrCDS12795 [Dimorphilus gyrociliatus]|uniref:DgyrCDS12795 n=1 Tax=Dimorphilus gyrociliatus TaxID=2664684 RepID=A0A7I8W8R8_9ANNE|nr:DgyrCDS12795 [Dimorphilus gyrociliatus]